MIMNPRKIVVAPFIIYGMFACFQMNAQDEAPAAEKPEAEAQPAAQPAAQPEAQPQATAQQEVAPLDDDQLQNVVKDEDLDRKKRCAAAEGCVAEGKSLAAQGKYKQAEAKFNEAMDAFGKLGGDYVELKKKQLKTIMEKFRVAWEMAIMDDAYRAFTDGKYDIAALKARDAQSIKDLPMERRGKIQKFVDLCEKRLASVEYRKKTDLADKDVDPGNKQRHYQIDVALKNARDLMDNRRFKEARDTIEKVLVRDPYNSQASYMLKDLYERLQDIGNKRRENDKLERMGEVTWKWIEPVLPMPARRPPDSTTNIVDSGTSSLSEKLARLVVPTINFKDVDIQAAVKYLKQESKQLDTAANGVGVNIILSLEDADLASVPKVTLNLSNLPLGEVVRYLCQKCGLNYRVENQALVIGTSAINPMDTRFFKVRGALIQRIAPNTAGGEAGDGDGGLGGMGESDFFAPEETFAGKGKSTKHDVVSDQLKAYFEERGVPFPDGSTIAYNRRSGRLAVTNTLENLRRLDKLIRALDMDQPQVLIESKFVEINQRDIEELGFEWWMDKTGDTARSKPWIFAPNDTLVRPLGYGTDTNDATARTPDGYASPVNSNVAGRLINDLYFPALGHKLNFNVHMMLHALDRCETSEVLSAPKVIAKSGNEAVIRMVKETYFPESWTEPTMSVLNSSVTPSPPTPEFGDPTDIGIKFTVTPEVSPDYHTIKLSLNPEVLVHVGWTNYGVPYQVGGVNGIFPVKMPEISRRDINANVKVYDGDTLVLGGMLTENAKGSDDSYPGTANVPLAGWLGRMQTSDKNKTNLMIFVTARIVNPDGLPIRLGPNNGKFDFRR